MPSIASEGIQEMAVTEDSMRIGVLRVVEASLDPSGAGVQSRLGGRLFRAARAVERLELGGHDRPAEVEALAELATMLEEEGALLLGLDSFGEWIQAQVAGQLDDRGDEHSRVSIVGQFTNERAI